MKFITRYFIIYNPILWLFFFIALYDLIIAFIFICGADIDCISDEFKYSNYHIVAEMPAGLFFLEVYKVRLNNEKQLYINIDIPGTMNGNFLLSIRSSNKIINLYKQRNDKYDAGYYYEQLKYDLSNNYLRIW
ncbi:MAG: hypothetical protein IJA81_02695 [Akkermansia sp.]|nr:hypothetical protein [Akkermansia sp.]MBQ9096133.1 hypothetical protein [Akkermansia sp.]